jgi:hypothetical protein
MRDHYEAIGNICAAAVANGDSIIQSVNEIESPNDELSITVRHGADHVTIAAPTTTEYFFVVVERRHQYLDQFDHNNLPHIQDAKEVLQDYEPLFSFDGNARILKYESGNVELFDGIAVHEPIYPYSSEFGLNEYRTVVTDVLNRSDDIFQHVRDELNIEMEGTDTAAEENTEPDRMGSFH